MDNDCDGLVDADAAGEPLAGTCYQGASGTEGVGACHAGTRTCDGGVWGACVGQTVPAPERCDGADDDCDGAIDPGCVCVPGASRPCYGGPEGTAGVGLCAAGVETCRDGGRAWGGCAGEVRPDGDV